MLTKKESPSAVPRKRRSIGRPSEPRLSVGRDGLIAVACELLKTTQPSLITRALVARESQVDPSLIRYYFKTNSALLIATADKLAGEFAERFDKALDQSDGSPEGRLSARVSTLLDLITTYPYFHRLIVEEIMPSNDQVAKALMAKFTHRGSSGYDAILRAGITDGRFRPVDHDLLFASIIGLCEFFHNAMRIVDISRGKSLDLEDAKREYKEFVCDLVLHGIRGGPLSTRRIDAAD